MFQFHKVQFKDMLDKFIVDKYKFQFHKVQFKGRTSAPGNKESVVSIP